MTSQTTIQDLKVNDLSKPFEDVNRLPLGSLIGRILTACVNAQETASNAAWEYVKQVLSHEAPMVFTFWDGKAMRRLEVPLVTIVPLPYIKLQDIKVDFDANVQVNNDYSNQFIVQINNASTENEITQSAKSAANMHVDIEAGTTDLPTGLAALLGYMNDGIIVEDIPPATTETDDIKEAPCVPQSVSSSSSSGYRSATDIANEIEHNSEVTLPKEPAPKEPAQKEPDAKEPDAFSVGVTKEETISSGSGSGFGRTVNEIIDMVEHYVPQSVSMKDENPVEEDFDEVLEEIDERVKNIKEEEVTSTVKASEEDRSTPKASSSLTSPLTSSLSSGLLNPFFMKEIESSLKASSSLKVTPMLKASDSLLLALHVNWTKPSQVRYPQKEYAIEDFDLLSTILSALLWRRLNGPIKLYTDNVGYDYYNNLGLLDLWDGGVDTEVLESIPTDIPADIFWAGAKLFAIRNQETPFVMMDTDLMVWDNIRERISGQQLMAFHSESLVEQAACYIDYKFLKKRKDYQPNPKWDWTQNPYNTALSYFNNRDFLKYYTDCAIDFMRGNAERPLEMVSQMVFAEQRVFAMCAKYMNIKVSTFLNSPTEPNEAFTHIWGGKDEARSNRTVGNRLCVTLARAIVNHFKDHTFAPATLKIINKYCKN